ncbi:RICIN domain-containing protein [Micromonospora sp. NPDC093277]|uniref:RICIN domain-containing protein n=1 Tax=Micromonospora sp. NPDC093277 TaxID=3364291 RepID=UPI003812225A
MQRKTRGTLAGLAVTGAAVASSLAVASPAQAASWYEIINYKSGKCMSIAGGGSTANGANAILWTCNDGWEQVWRWSGRTLVNGKSGKCLSVSGGGSTSNGANIIQWTCNGGPEQDWYPSNGYLVNGKSGKVLSVSGGGSTANGAEIIQWSANGGSEQGWLFNLHYADV